MQIYRTNWLHLLYHFPVVRYLALIIEIKRRPRKQLDDSKFISKLYGADKPVVSFHDWSSDSPNFDKGDASELDEFLEVLVLLLSRHAEIFSEDEEEANTFFTSVEVAEECPGFLETIGFFARLILFSSEK